ncbi:MAG: SRPBCC domain-containing protein [Saprospiraceae bacterium]|nr:SRPBCC domain-containing protein [Saprospiraceae bacterium]
MQMKSFAVDVGIQIQKPAYEIYEAIVDPEKMCNYFISQSSGRMESGKSLIWKFPEFDMDIPVRIGKLIPNEYISYTWDQAGIDLNVEMRLESLKDGSTLVQISEQAADSEKLGIDWLKGNTEGWSNFLACLKAYLEYGINLRKGAFIYRGNISTE